MFDISFFNLFLQWLIPLPILILITRTILTRFFSKPHSLPPGPKGWPVLGCLPLLGPNPHVSFAKLSRQYGPIMYLKMGTSNVVIATSPSTVKTFLKTLDHKFTNRPIGAGPTYIAYDAQDMVFANVGPRWKHLRRITNLHLLGSKSFADWAPLRAREVTLMVNDILELSRVRKEVNVMEVVSCALANVIGMKSISKRVFAAGHGEESSEFKEMITELMRLAGLFNVGDFIPAVEWLDLQGIQGKMKKLHHKFDGLITKMLEDHLASTSERLDNPDFFDIVMGGADSRDSNDGVMLNMVNFKALLLNLFIAGTDTTSVTVEWSMAELLTNPHCLNRLQSEIDSVVGNTRLLHESDIPNLPYLQAVTKETFRLHPATPLNLPRLSSEDCEVDGYHIPKNTTLFVNMWAIARDPNVWEDPLRFEPERFLTEGKHAGVEPLGNDYELLPFGSGRRICAGMRMGVAMAQFLIGTLVHSFEWGVEGEVNMEEKFGLVLGMAKELRAMAKPRLESSAYLSCC